MGCSVSRLELRAGRGSTESGLRSIKHKIVDEVSRCDRGIVTCTYSSDTAKLLAKESVGRNSVVAPPNDYKKPPQPPVTENVRRGLEAKSIKSTNYEENNYDGELEGDGGGKGGGSVISDFDGALWMASPSFREYCLPEVDGDDSDDDSVVKGIATVIVKGNSNFRSNHIIFFLSNFNNSRIYYKETICTDNPDLENISNKENVGRDMEVSFDLHMHLPNCLEIKARLSTVYNFFLSNYKNYF